MHKNYVYLLENDKILKLLVTIDLQIIKESFIKVYNSIQKNYFIEVNESIVNKLNFPIEMESFKINDRKFYSIPNKEFIETDLLYLLNKIYNEKSLSSEDLFKLNLEREYNSTNNLKVAKMWVRIVEEVISKLNIEIIDKYSFSKFSNSLEYLENIEHKENLYNRVELNEFKNLLLTAEGNKDIFEDLGINVQTSKKKQKKKVNK